MSDPISQRNKKRLMILGTLSLVTLASILLYYFFYKPNLETMGHLKREVELKQLRFEQEVEAQTLAITTARKEIDLWKTKVDELNKRLPGKEDFEHLLLHIGKVANRYRLRDFHLKVIPKDKGAKKGPGDNGGPQVAGNQERRGTVGKDNGGQGGGVIPFESLELSISFNSGYRNMARFIDSMTESMRAMSFETIEIKGRDDRMVTSMLIRAYYRSDNEKVGY
jgi:Tfp pilus assembly protein PilO